MAQANVGVSDVDKVITEEINASASGVTTRGSALVNELNFFKEMQDNLSNVLTQQNEALVIENDIENIQAAMKNMYSINSKLKQSFHKIKRLDKDEKYKFVDGEYDSMEAAVDAHTKAAQETIHQLRFMMNEASSLSNRSVSSTGSVNQQRLKLKREAAALQVKLKFVNAEKNKEAELESLKLQKEIASKQAESEACEELENAMINELSDPFQPPEMMNETNKVKMNRYFSSGFRSESAKQEVSHPDTQTANAQNTSAQSTRPKHVFTVPDRTPVQRNHTEYDSIRTLAECTRQLACSSRLPFYKLEPFGGDVLKFPAWERAFNSQIEPNCFSENELLTQLEIHLINRPLSMVKSMLLTTNENSYALARERLRHRFGNESVISTEFTKKVTNWKRIENNDNIELQTFADFIEQLLVAKETITALNIFDFPEKSNCVLEKLPTYIRNRWKDIVFNWRKIHGQGSYPSFKNLSNFVSECADKENIAELTEVNSHRHRENANQRSNSEHRRSRNYHSSAFATEVGTPEVSGSEEEECYFCEQDHLLDKCKMFMKINMKERKTFILRNGICFGCGKSKDHQAKDCQASAKCTKCQKKHMTCMHNEESTHVPYSADVMLTESPNAVKQDSSMIVPVYVRSRSNPGEEVLCYGILDGHSTSCFISDNLKYKLKLDGTKTNLSISTIHSQNKVVNSHRIKDLEIVSYDRKVTVKLPPVFSREIISESKNQIPTRTKASKWSHLKSIKDKIPPLMPNLEIAMLIGRNVANVLRPLDIVNDPSKPDAPYAQKSVLGWGIVGCSDSMETNEHIVLSSIVKEQSSSPEVEQIMESKHKSEDEKSSVDDQLFLDKVEESIHKRPDGHEMSMLQDTIDYSKVWDYVAPKENPVDLESCGLGATELESSKWFTTSKFLRETSELKSDVIDMPYENGEVKENYGNIEDFHLSSKLVNSYFDVKRLSHISKWFGTKRSVANAIKYSKLYRKLDADGNVEMLCDDVKLIIKGNQQDAFQEIVTFERVKIIMETRTMDDEEFVERSHFVRLIQKLVNWFRMSSIHRRGAKLKRKICNHSRIHGLQGSHVAAAPQRTPVVGLSVPSNY